jgi:hypothetical protein
MDERTYEVGYCDGWESVAGKEPMTVDMAYPPEGDARDYKAGFRYGRSEAEMHFRPGDTDHPEPTGL